MGVIAWVREGVCVGGTALIAASKYVHVCIGEGREEGEGGGCVWVGGCDCVDVGVIMWVGVGVIAWVRKGVCGWDSLDCCLKVRTSICVSGEGGVRCGWVGVTVWMWV